MADGQGADGGADEKSGFDWLYGGAGRNASPPGHPTPPPATGPGGAPEPEHTRVLPVTPPAPTRRPQPAPPPSGPRTPPPAGPAARPPRKRRFRYRWLWLLPVLWLAFLLAVPLFAWNSVSKVDAFPKADRPAEQPGTTTLIVGSDARRGLAGRRTDTIMLMHTGKGPNLLMSIPRDSLVEVPGYGVTKVNAAFAFGGPKLLVRTLENETGIHIDHYLEIGFGGFVKIVDAVGGIEICPKRNMRDPLAHLNVKKGCQEVDGRTALAYSRSRHVSALGDIDRAAHQREVVSAVGHEAVSWQTFVNPFRYWRLSFAAADAIRVSEGTGPIETARIALAMTRVDGKSGLSCGVPISDLAVHWDRDRADKLFRLIREDRADEVGKAICTPDGLDS